MIKIISDYDISFIQSHICLSNFILQGYFFLSRYFCIDLRAFTQHCQKINLINSKSSQGLLFRSLKFPKISFEKLTKFPMFSINYIYTYRKKYIWCSGVKFPRQNGVTISGDAFRFVSIFSTLYSL